VNNFFDNKKLPELDNNVDWLKVECATKKKTQNIKSILKKPWLQYCENSETDTQHKGG
jgi:hypothetical protein